TCRHERSSDEMLPLGASLAVILSHAREGCGGVRAVCKCWATVSGSLVHVVVSLVAVPTPTLGAAASPAWVSAVCALNAIEVPVGTTACQEKNSHSGSSSVPQSEA